MSLISYRQIAAEKAEEVLQIKRVGRNAFRRLEMAIDLAEKTEDDPSRIIALIRAHVAAEKKTLSECGAE